MPDPALAQAIAEAYASAPDTVVILHTLEFRHPSFSVPLRVVRDHADLTATLEAGAPVDAGQAVLFTGYPFEFELPQVDDGTPPELTITIDNVDRAIVENLELAVASTAKLAVTYRPYVSSDLSAPQMDPPLHMTVTRIEADVFRVVARCAFSDLTNLQFPREDYTADRFPGLVA